jgi:hypothetical protein
MKPAASLRGAWRRLQHGSSAVELAIVLSATMVVLPAVALFAKVFFQYSVIKAATQDVGVYLGTLPPAAILDPIERARVFGVAQQMIDSATVDAGLTGTSQVFGPQIKCDDLPCGTELPERVFRVSLTLSINDTMFNALTGSWTSERTNNWQVGAETVVPYVK